jgi:hypothetical protein
MDKLEFRARVVTAALWAVTGIILIAAAVGIPQSWAARNSAGTYSLPSPSNPVVTGTTITSTWANTTLADLATEVTNSLDRSGRGCMTGQMQSASGTSSAPGITFCSDVSSGFWRAGDDDIRFGIDSAENVEFNKNIDAFRVSLYTDAGVTAVNGITNASAITAIGNGSGSGVAGTGGGTNGAGLSGTGGATNGSGVVGTGAGTGAGIFGTGGTTGPGGSFTAGTSSTATDPTVALKTTNGGVQVVMTDPNKDEGFTETVTTNNIPKAWGSINVTGGGGGNFTVASLDGFNIASVARTSSTAFTVTIADDFADTNYAVMAQAYASSDSPNTSTKAAGSFRLTLYRHSTDALVDLDAAVGSMVVDFVAFGRQ